MMIRDFNLATLQQLDTLFVIGQEKFLTNH